MQRTFHFAVGSIHSALAIGIIFRLNFDDVTLCIFCTAVTFHDIRAFQAYLLTRRHTEKLLRSILHKVFFLYPKITRKGNRVRTIRLVFRIVDAAHLFCLTFGIVGNNQFHGINHRRNTASPFVQVFSNRCFEQRHIVQRVEFGITYRVDKPANTLRRVTSAPHSAQRWHTWVVPSCHQMLVYQRMQLALAHHSVRQIQSVKLNLARSEVVNVLRFAIHFFQEIDELIVQRTVRNKLERTNRVRNAFEVIALSVCKVIHRISVPSGSGAMMRCVNNAIDNRVAKVHVGIAHIELGA